MSVNLFICKLEVKMVLTSFYKFSVTVCGTVIIKSFLSANEMSKASGNILINVGTDGIIMTFLSCIHDFRLCREHMAY